MFTVEVDVTSCVATALHENLPAVLQDGKETVMLILWGFLLHTSLQN